MGRIRFLAVRVRDSFWFVPAVAIAAAIVVAEVVVALDRSLGFEGVFILDVGPEGARGLLAAIATSMLAVAATMFSITIAVLALTSSAYGPRLVRNFMSDRGNQFVLSVLVSTSLYALLVLRWVRAGAEEFVPGLAVSTALALTVVCISSLIYFIQHISVGIQISTLSGAVRSDLARRLEQTFPAELPDSTRPASVWPAADGSETVVVAERDGYVADISAADLVRAASAVDGRIEMLVRPGGFVCQGDHVALVVTEGDEGREQSVDARRTSLVTAVRTNVAVQDERTPYQDVEHLARQLVDIAVRAMSSGVNDPYTAVGAIDALTAAFAGTAANPEPHPVLVDGDGLVRLRLTRRAWADVVVEVVDAIRSMCAGQPIVAERLLDLLGALAVRATDPARRAALIDAADRVISGVEAPNVLDLDRDRLLAAAAWRETVRS